MSVQFRLKLCSFLEAPPAQVTEEMSMDDASTHEDDSGSESLVEALDKVFAAEGSMQMTACTPTKKAAALGEDSPTTEEKVKPKVQYALARFFGGESSRKTAVEVNEMILKNAALQNTCRGRPSAHMKVVAEAKQKGETVIAATLAKFNNAVDNAILKGRLLGTNIGDSHATLRHQLVELNLRVEVELLLA